MNCTVRRVPGRLPPLYTNDSMQCPTIMNRNPPALESSNNARALRVATTAGAPHGSRGRGQVSLTASQPVTVHEVAAWELPEGYLGHA